MQPGGDTFDSSQMIPDSATMALAYQLSQVLALETGLDIAQAGIEKSQKGHSGELNTDPMATTTSSADPGTCASSDSGAGSGSGLGTEGGSRDGFLRRQSVNSTVEVEVPSSEHVAEIVGKQGAKVKALRAKTNTYIKTPVRGEEPVFIITGRTEDVLLAEQEIRGAAEHFTQIRASRRHSQGGDPAPGHITDKLEVPYKVVGLVVGPKGATIKRIQQDSHTYIVTPSREKEPVFEITGIPENVEIAKRLIQSHIDERTTGPPPPSGAHHQFPDEDGGSVYSGAENPSIHVNNAASRAALTAGGRGGTPPLPSGPQFQMSQWPGSTSSGPTAAAAAAAANGTGPQAACPLSYYYLGNPVIKSSPFSGAMQPIQLATPSSVTGSNYLSAPQISPYSSTGPQSSPESGIWPTHHAHRANAHLLTTTQSEQPPQRQRPTTPSQYMPYMNTYANESFGTTNANNPGGALDASSMAPGGRSHHDQPMGVEQLRNNPHYLPSSGYSQNAQYESSGLNRYDLFTSSGNFNSDRFDMNHQQSHQALALSRTDLSSENDEGISVSADSYDPLAQGAHLDCLIGSILDDLDDDLPKERYFGSSHNSSLAGAGKDFSSCSWASSNDRTLVDDMSGSIFGTGPTSSENGHHLPARRVSSAPLAPSGGLISALCALCQSRPANCGQPIGSCGHGNFCGVCFSHLMKTPGSKCPVCDRQQQHRGQVPTNQVAAGFHN